MTGTVDYDSGVGRESKRAFTQAAIIATAALVWRIWLSWRYFGWEESDYGNLMLVRQVVDSGFTWFNPAYMPGFYTMAGAVRLVVDDPRISALILTMAFSVVGTTAAAMVTRKVVGEAAAWLVGAWLVFQPDAALQGSSTLRYPVFGALAAISAALLVWGRPKAGFAAVGLAFLTRMEAVFVYFPPALWSRWRDRGLGARSLVLPLAFLLGLVGLWQLYVTEVFHEGFFLAGPVSLSMESGSAFEVDTAARKAFTMMTWTLPRKLGWTWITLAGVGFFALGTGQGRPGGRALAAWAAVTTLYWAALGFVSSLDVNHNLFWAWMLPAVPLLAVMAGAGWAYLDGLAAASHPVLRAAAFGAVMLSVVPSFVSEAGYQMDRSERWYRPQLEHARWVEDNAPTGSAVLTSAIPEVWLTRKPNRIRVFAYWKLPDEVRDVPPATVGAFLLREDIRYVWWFREEWTDANAILPDLARGERVELGEAVAVPVDREDEYGWILYVVHRKGEPPPPAPPPYASGSLKGPGWWR
jgi:hypothetical protein